MCALTTPNLGMSELIAWGWLGFLFVFELCAAQEGFVLVLKDKISVYELCCAFLDAGPSSTRSQH